MFCRAYPSIAATLLCALVGGTAAAQISTALPPQTIGTLSADQPEPTELQQVQKLMAAGRNEQALERADAQLAKNPRDAQMRFVRGVILTELKQPAAAREVFERLTQEFPELPEPYNNLAVLYAGEGKLDNARAALQMALAAAPNYGTAYENLGDVYLQMAADAYQRAAAVEPGNRQATTKLTLSRELISKTRGAR